MGYWQAKSDLEFICQFKAIAVRFMVAESERQDLENGGPERKFGDAWGRIDEQARRAVDNFYANYRASRQDFVKSIDRVSSIGDKHSIPYVLQLSPPPAIGGYVRRVNTYQALLEELPWGAKVQPQRLIDIIDQTEGACERHLKAERRRLYNPLYWAIELMTFILRLPFLLLSTAGFHIEKFEEQLWARLFKLAELLVVLYAVHRWGVKPEKWVQDLIASLISK